MMKRTGIMLAVIACLGLAAQVYACDHGDFGPIQGPSKIVLGRTYTYTAQIHGAFKRGGWSITGGTLLKSWQQGSTSYAQVRWNRMNSSDPTKAKIWGYNDCNELKAQRLYVTEESSRNPGSSTSPGSGSSQRIRCKSRDYDYNYCRVQTNNRVRLVRRLSDAACTEGYSWGYDRNGIWVDHGCGAEFEVRSSGGGRPGRPPHRPEEPEESDTRRITCRSRDYDYNYCRVRTDGRVRLVRQYSDAACQKGRTWGYDERGIWVDRGCSAEFEVGYKRVYNRWQ